MLPDGTVFEERTDFEYKLGEEQVRGTGGGGCRQYKVDEQVRGTEGGGGVLHDQVIAVRMHSGGRTVT
jgi:hypothetical protein